MILVKGFDATIGISIKIVSQYTLFYKQYSFPTQPQSSLNSCLGVTYYIEI